MNCQKTQMQHLYLRQGCRWFYPLPSPVRRFFTGDFVKQWIRRMYIVKTVSAMFIAVAVWSVSAISAERMVETGPGIYRLTGDRAAISACEAVIRDNLGKLKRTLRRHKSPAVLILPVKDFYCNGTHLLAFAEDMGSDSVAQYLLRYNWRNVKISVDHVAQVQFSSHQ